MEMETLTLQFSIWIQLALMTTQCWIKLAILKTSNLLSEEQQSVLQPERHNLHMFAFQAVKLRNWWPWKLIYPLTPKVVPPGQAWAILVGQCGGVWSDYQWISLSSYKVFHCSVFQRDGSHGAALAIRYKKAVPWFLSSQRKTRRLRKACLVWVCVVSVLFVPTPSESKADSFL